MCKICEKAFEKPFYLQRHMRGHTDMFKCQACLKRFARKEGLIKHMCKAKDSSSSEAAKFKESCEFCGKEFTNRKYLIQHIAAHTGMFTISERTVSPFYITWVISTCPG